MTPNGRCECTWRPSEQVGQRGLSGARTSPHTRATSTPPQARQQWFRDYLRTVIERDIKDLSGARRTQELPKLLKSLAARSAGELVVKNLHDDTGFGSRHTTEAYLGYLQMTYLVLQLWTIGPADLTSLDHWPCRSHVSGPLALPISRLWTIGPADLTSLDHWPCRSHVSGPLALPISCLWTIGPADLMSLDHWPCRSHVSGPLALPISRLWTIVPADLTSLDHFLTSTGIAGDTTPL